MGRKIPGKKHHGVKDPEKQQKARLDKIKMKINARPAKEDYQDVPKSLRMIMAAKEKLKSENTPVMKRKRKGPEEKARLDSTKHLYYDGPNQKGMTKPLKPIPVFKQSEGEHKRAFYYRIDKTIQSMKKRAEFEEKYKVDVQTDGQGKSMVVDREKDEVELEEEKKKIERLAKKGIVRKTKEEKRVLRRQREKQRKNKKKGVNISDNLDFNDFKDDVAFGDRVDAPPTLNFRGFEKSSSSKPAENGGLLLSQKSNENNDSVKSKKSKLSMAQKVRIERERSHVVAQYRAKKAAALSTG